MKRETFRTEATIEEKKLMSHAMTIIEQRLLRETTLQEQFVFMSGKEQVIQCLQ